MLFELHLPVNRLIRFMRGLLVIDAGLSLPSLYVIDVRPGELLVVVLNCVDARGRYML